MIKICLSLGIGFGLGIIMELLVVQYHSAVIDLNAKRGAISTWGIGHINFFMLIALASYNNPYFYYGLIYGETLASYYGIARRKKANT